MEPVPFEIIQVTQGDENGDVTMVVDGEVEDASLVATELPARRWLIRRPRSFRPEATIEAVPIVQ